MCFVPPVFDRYMVAGLPDPRRRPKLAV